MVILFSDFSSVQKLIFDCFKEDRKTYSKYKLYDIIFKIFCLIGFIALAVTIGVLSNFYNQNQGNFMTQFQ